jgi:hypothetical protein
MRMSLKYFSLNLDVLLQGFLEKTLEAVQHQISGNLLSKKKIILILWKVLSNWRGGGFCVILWDPFFFFIMELLIRKNLS